MIEIGMKDSFSNEMRRLNKEIRGLEKDLRSMDRQFKNYGKSVDGLAEKQKTLSQIIEKTQSKQARLIQERDTIIAKYQKEAEELKNIEQQYGKNSKKYNEQAQKMVDSATQLNRVNEQLDSVTKTTRKHQADLEQITQEYNRLISGTKTYNEKLESIKNNTEELTEELELEQKVLQSQSKTWKEFDNVVKQNSTRLQASIDTYKTHREELSRLSQEEEKYTRLKQENSRVLTEEISKLEQIRRTHGEVSTEYENQIRYVEELRSNNRQYVETLAEISTQHEEVSKSMRQSRREIIENGLSLKELGSTKITQTLHKTSDVLTTYGEKLAGTSIASGAFAGGSIAIFSEYEQGLAKVSTLVDESVVDIDRVGQDIIRISNETGKSVSDVMESAYDALSSGVEIGNLNEFLATSSKLATAGFTSSSSAVKLMSQVLNNYGESAGNAEQIASKLIKTQDLGVLTVDEMAQSMSESLALASTFGMSFDNVASAFAKMTLSGTSASESGTQIARMLEELGNTSSTVSGILEQKTGKSFTELANSGMDLYDILGIIQEYANETGTSMTELWSSSNAGIGALQILSAEGDQFKDILAEITGSSGTLDANFNKLSETSAFKLSSAINELKNSLIEIGGAFAPVIESVSSIISTLAKGINALPQPIKNVMATLAGIGTVISPVALGLGKVAKGFFDIAEDAIDVKDIISQMDWSNVTNAGSLFKEFFDTKGARQQTQEMVQEVTQASASIVQEVTQASKDATSKAMSEMQVLFNRHPLEFNLSEDPEINQIALNARDRLQRAYNENPIEFQVSTENLINDPINAIDEIQDNFSQLEFDLDTGDIVDDLGNVVEVTDEVVSAFDSQLEFDLNTGDIIDDMGHIVSRADDVTDAVTDVASATSTSTSVFSKLGGVMKAHPLLTGVGATVALGVAIWGVSKAVEAYNAKMHEGRDAVAKYNKAIEENKTNMQQISNQKENLTGLLDRYNELSQKTHLTAQETEEYKNILQQVAKIDPNLVEYDKNGDPIKLKTDLVEDLIAKLDVAYKKQETLMNQNIRNVAKSSKKAYDEEANERADRKTQLELDRQKNNYTTTNMGLETSNWLKKENESWDDYAKRMSKHIAEDRRINDELIAIRDEDIASRQQVSNARRDYYQNEIENSKRLKDLTEEEKGIFSNMIDTFDFSQFDDTQVDALFNKISSGYSKLDTESRKAVDGMIGKQNELNTAFVNGTMTAQEYESATHRNAIALSNLLGISTEEAKELLLSIEFDADKAHEGIDKATEVRDSLVEEMLSWRELDPEARVEFAMELALDENTPDHISEKIHELAEGGITDEELEILIELSAEVNEENMNSEFRTKMDEMKTKLSQTDDVKVKQNIIIEYATQVSDNQSLMEFLDATVGRTHTIEINTLIESGDIDGLIKKVDSLPEEQQTAVRMAILSSGELTFAETEKFLKSLPKEEQKKLVMDIAQSGDLTTEEMKDFLLGVPEETRTECIMEMMESGDYTAQEMLEYIETLPESKKTEISADVEALQFDAFVEKLDAMPIDKTTKLNVEKAVAEGNVDALLTSIEHLPPEKQLAIIADSSDALGKISDVDLKKIQNKVSTITGDNRDALNKISTVQREKLENKNFTVKATDQSTSVLTTIKGWLDSIKSKAITVTTRRIMTGGSGGSIWDKSVNPPRVVEEDVIVKSNISAPRIVDNLTNGLTSVDNQISNARNTISANMDNVVSALASSVDTYADTGYVIRAIESDVDLLENLNAVIDKLTASLNKLESQQERTWGSSKAKLLQQEISLLQEQQRLTKATENNMKQMADTLRGSLRDKGFTFNSDGSIDNYNTKLISMTENVEKLKKKMDDYKGEDEKQKDKLSKAYNDANDALSKTKEQLDQYLNLTFNEMPNAQAEWEDLQNSIADAKAEIIEATHEARVFSDVIRSELQEAVIGKFDTQIDTLDVKMDLAGFDDQMKYLEQQIDLMNQAIEKTEGLIGSMSNQRNWAKDTLLNQGFEFDHQGNIKNAESKLKKLRDSLSTSEYEAIKNIYDEYVDLHYSTLPDLEKQWLDYKASIKEAEKEIEEIEKEIKELKSNAKLDTLEQSFEHLNEELEILESRFDNAISTKEKTKLLMEQLRLIQRIKTEQQGLTDEYRNQANILKNDLAKYGVKFDYDDSIKNLEQAMNNLTDIEQMEELQDLADAYNDMLSSMNDGVKEVEELENQMSELRDEMLELQKEFENFKITTWTQKLENGLKILENDLEKLQNSADLTNTNMIKNWNQQIDKIHELENKTAEMISFYKQRQNQLQKDLVDFGFSFNDDGSISNYYEQLTQLKNAMTETSFDLLNESLEEYFDISLDTIPELENQLIDFKKELENIANEKLETTKEIEDKITEVYEKEIEKRIEEIEKEKDARIEALEKARKEYEKFRDEAQYEDDYNEQLQTVQDLQAKVEIAKRDTSLVGQKRLQELMEQLEEEQKSLQDLVRDKVDQDINDMFDNEMDRLETNAEKEIKELEELWSASKVAEAVQQALATGIFEDIDGNIKELDNALLDFANSSEEYFGVMGDKLKSELVLNLQTALGVVQELDKAISKIDYDSVRFAGVGYNAQAMASTTNNNTTNNTNNNTINVDFNPSYTFTAEGGSSLDENAVQDIIQQSKEEITREIEHAILKNIK